MPRSTLAVLFALISLSAALADSRLTNVSVRSGAGTGGDTLIVGFTIVGGTKQMLVRGIGPSLGAFGVSGAMTDPELRIFGPSNSLVASNDNWGGATAIDAAAATVGAFRIPGTSADAALLVSLPSGSYSSHIIGNGGPGIALVEAYEADPSLTSSTGVLTNVSSRSLSGTGAGVLTVGFAITGDEKRTVVIRAVGPSLTTFGVEGAMANPQLRLFSSRNGEIGYNDDWLTGANWPTTFRGVGAFSLGATTTRDAALVVHLPPGTYTAQATGVNNTTGVALIEVYMAALQSDATFVYWPAENAIPPGYPVAVGVVANPVVLTQARPVYPFELRRAGAEGQALIQFVVEPDGLVSNAIVLRTHDYRLGDAALAAVRQWTFRPGRNASGQSVRTVMQVPVVFTLSVN